jgi:pimeloyl-ACP methyl ester carboxylesterase
LSFVDSGYTDGKPVFFFPGFGVSASAVHPDAALAESVGIRVVAVDRPGIGKSSHAPNRALSDWSQDVAELADRLAIPRFGLLGWSGGGPHALACAYYLGGRVSVTGLFACAPPFADSKAIASMPSEVKRLAFIARFAPLLVRLGFWSQCRQIRSDPDAVMRKSARDLSRADQTLLSDPRFHDCLRRSMIEACSQGPRGLVDDVLAIARPWGFRPEQIKCPVQIWHGDADTTIPADVGRWLASTIANCRIRFFAREGHFAYLTHWSEILETLAASM